jgi:periplasmic protein TonB
MKRRLFEDLVVSVAGARTRGGLALPVSVAVHAAGVAALLALPALTTEALPEPPALRLQEPVVLAMVHITPPPPPAAAAPRAPRPTGSRRPAAATAVVSAPRIDAQPMPDPNALLIDEPDLDPPAGDGRLCLGCVMPPVPVGDDGDPVGVEGGRGTGPLPVGGLIRAPSKVRDARPAYPEIAKTARVQGAVLIECIIATDGRVENVRVVSGHPLLQGPALEAVSQWRYTPSFLNGVPVSVIMTVTVNFILS